MEPQVSDQLPWDAGCSAELACWNLKLWVNSPVCPGRRPDTDRAGSDPPLMRCRPGAAGCTERASTKEVMIAPLELFVAFYEIA